MKSKMSILRFIFREHSFLRDKRCSHWEKCLLENVWINHKILIISIRILVISTSIRILIDLTKKFYYIFCLFLIRSLQIFVSVLLCEKQGSCIDKVECYMLLHRNLSLHWINNILVSKKKYAYMNNKLSVKVKLFNKYQT